MKVNKIDIVVLNYNGTKILPECLPTLVAAAKKSPVPCRVMVLDNKSTDGSVEYIKNTFKDVRVEIARENRILFSYNELVPRLDSDVVILLNNDVKAESDFIAPLIERFADDSVFAVAPKQLSFSGKTHEGGKNKLEFSSGLMHAGPFYGEDPVMEKEGVTFYEANSAYDRRKFMELGGFDDIYYPSLWEDADIAYRAWKSGYKFRYEPLSVTYHYESFTFDQEVHMLKDRRVRARRNSFIFTWKNITDRGMLMTHILLLPVNLFTAIFNDWARITAFFKALKYLPLIMRKRRALKFKLSDREVFERAE